MLVAIVMLAVSPTASPGIVSEKIATKAVYKALKKFLISFSVMMCLPTAAQ